MSSLILHHFDASPFSEKVRLLLGYKELAWDSVKIPRIMPKPDLMPLTGGYRKTPVMQLGRDIYCDTRLIARTIERIAPSPSVLPAAHQASISALEQMADRQMFLAAIPVLFRPAGRQALQEQLGADYLARFQADRAKLFAGGSVARPDDSFSRAVWEPTLAALDAQLAHATFLVGDTPTLADFAVFHPVWYVRSNSGMAHTLDRFANLMRWFERMRAFGHGRPHELASADALARAETCREWEALAGDFDTSLELTAGQAVAVAARDYGVDAVRGDLVHLNADSATIERQVPSLGSIRVHFPRDGFLISAA